MSGGQKGVRKTEMMAEKWGCNKITRMREPADSAMDSSIPGQESCQQMTGPLTDFVHKIVKS